MTSPTNADDHDGESAVDPAFDRTRSGFVDLAADDGPAVVRVEATLDVDIEPLAAYAAISGRTAERPGDADSAGTSGDSGSDYSFLLESAEKVASSDPDGAFAPDPSERHARFSFVGYDPEAVVTVDPGETRIETLDSDVADLLGPAEGDVLDRLRAAMPDVELRGFPESERQHLDGGLVGFLSYDAVYDLWLDEVGVERPDSPVPDAQFVLTTRTLQFDHAEDRVSLVFTPVIRPDDDAGARYEDLVDEAERVARLLSTTDTDDGQTDGFVRADSETGPRAEYEQAVERAREHVLAGDIYQGVISRTRELSGEIDPLALYASLRSINPSPYMYLLDHDDRAIVGASPETLVSVAGDRVVANPIAGTCPRGNSPVEDRRLAGELLADDKERAEHTMLVDLARNDVRRVAEPGSVRVPEFMNVLKYSHVQHIESTVTGTLAADADAFDAVRATFPAGTLSGAPKIRAMELIDEFEQTPRGIYGGGVGYVAWHGDADFAIVIRTATIDRGDAADSIDRGDAADSIDRGDAVDSIDRADAADSIDRADDTDRVTVRAGAGIVADSDPASEYEETEQKMRGVLDALEAIEFDPGSDATGADTGDPPEETGTDRPRVGEEVSR